MYDEKVTRIRKWVKRREGRVYQKGEEEEKRERGSKKYFLTKMSSFISPSSINPTSGV